MNEVGKVQKVKSPFPKNTMGRGEDQGTLVDSCSAYRGQLTLSSDGLLLGRKADPVLPETWIFM